VRVLLLHQNFPGQFLHLAPALVQRGDDVVAVSRRVGSYPDLLDPAAAAATATSGRLRWLSSGGSVDDEMRHPDPARRLLAPWHQARRVVAALTPLAVSRWRPDVVLAHCFWGDALLLDDLFPGVPLVAVLELDLASPRLHGIGSSSAGRQLQQWADAMAIRRMAVGLTASRFQRDTYPAWLHPRLRVIHEGVDVEACGPDPLARLRLASGFTFGAESMVLTFAARSLEPLRGLDRLLAVLPALQRRLPRLHVVLAGACDQGCYGPPPPQDKPQADSWLNHLLARFDDDIDRSRLHTPGLLPPAQLRDLFRISAAHVYLSRPYVPSWSLVEAMACGAPVVATADAGVDEWVLDGVTGKVVPADDPQALVESLLPMLENPITVGPLRLGARRHSAAHFDQRRSVSAQMALLDAVARGQPPPLP
jgi:glycosyltransferase involved in cell wall biosynthesis